MSDLLQSLVQRNVDGVAPVVRPRLAARFEAALGQAPETLSNQHLTDDSPAVPSRPFGTDNAEADLDSVWNGFKGEPRWDREYGERLDDFTSQLRHLRGLVETPQDPLTTIVREASQAQPEPVPSAPSTSAPLVTSETIREQRFESRVETPIVRLTQLLHLGLEEKAGTTPSASPQSTVEAPPSIQSDASDSSRRPIGTPSAAPPRIQPDRPLQPNPSTVESEISTEPQIIRLTQLLSPDHDKTPASAPAALSQSNVGGLPLIRREVSNSPHGSLRTQPTAPTRIEPDRSSLANQAAVGPNASANPQIVIERQQAVSDTPPASSRQATPKQPTPFKPPLPLRAPRADAVDRPDPQQSSPRGSVSTAPVPVMPAQTHRAANPGNLVQPRTAPRIQVEMPTAMTRQPQIVQVTIGRIEVRAPSQQPPAAPPRPRRSASSVMTLDQYLRRRAGGDQ